MSAAPRRAHRVDRREDTMRAGVYVVRLKLVDLLDLPRAATVVLRSEGVWLAWGVLAAVGVVTLVPATIYGVLVMPIVLTMLLGASCWIGAWQRGEAEGNLPGWKLLRLGIVLAAMLLPLLGFGAMTAGIGGMLMLFGISFVLYQTSAEFAMWFGNFFSTLPFLSYALAFCFAPFLVANRGCGVRQALALNLRLWLRNPGPCLLFVGLAVMLAGAWALSTWLRFRYGAAGRLLHCLGSWLGGSLLTAALAAFARKAVARDGSGPVPDGAGHAHPARPGSMPP
jgi:hypothetical protein